MFLLTCAFVRTLKAPPIAPSALSDRAQGPSLGPRGPSGPFGGGAALRAAFRTLRALRFPLGASVRKKSSLAKLDKFPQGSPLRWRFASLEVDSNCVLLKSVRILWLRFEVLGLGFEVLGPGFEVLGPGFEVFCAKAQSPTRNDQEMG